jgi:hypothetical protein
LTRFIAASTPSERISSTASAASFTDTSSSSRSRLPGRAARGRRPAPWLGLAHADAHPHELVGVQVGLDGPQPVVPGQSPAPLDLDAAQGQVELVVDDDDALGVGDAVAA